MRRGIPGIDRGAVVVIDTRAAEGELDQMRFAKEYSTGGEEAAGNGGVGFSYIVAQQY